jgi:hypothetical protein
MKKNVKDLRRTGVAIFTELQKYQFWSESDKGQRRGGDPCRPILVIMVLPFLLRSMKITSLIILSGGQS